MKLYLASNNPHKAAEFAALAAAASRPWEIRSARECGGMPPVVEDTGTFHGNAEKKARALLPRIPPGAWVLADDSGLGVAALEGRPGVESAYFAGPAASDAANREKLLREMQAVPDGARGAWFHCTLCLLNAAGEGGVFTGRVDGAIARAPAGGGGFGYDPVFVPAGLDATLAGLSAAGKNAVSHRARAFAALAGWLAAYQMK